MTEYPTSIAELTKRYGQSAGEVALSAFRLAQEEDGAPLRCRRRACRRNLRCLAVRGKAKRPDCNAGISANAEARGDRVTSLVLDLWNSGLLSLEDGP